MKSDFNLEEEFALCIESIYKSVIDNFTNNNYTLEQAQKLIDLLDARIITKNYEPKLFEKAINPTYKNVWGIDINGHALYYDDDMKYLYDNGGIIRRLINEKYNFSYQNISYQSDWQPSNC